MFLEQGLESYFFIPYSFHNEVACNCKPCKLHIYKSVRLSRSLIPGFTLLLAGHDVNLDVVFVPLQHALYVLLGHPV